jgi:FAD/FMN-containing dehydrogenase
VADRRREQRNPVWAQAVRAVTLDGEARVRAAYPGATWNRLADVKAAYDPENLFRLNQNIPPARG